MDNIGLLGGHLHVREVIPSGQMDARPARHLLRSVVPLQLLILCSHCAFGVLERSTGRAPVRARVAGLHLLSRLDGEPEPYIEVATVAAILAGRSDAWGFAIKEPRLQWNPKNMSEMHYSTLTCSGDLSEASRWCP